MHLTNFVAWNFSRQIAEHLTYLKKLFLNILLIEIVFPNVEHLLLYLYWKNILEYISVVTLQNLYM